MCENDGDCPGALLCYTNLSWTDTPICDCSHFYGGAGPNCEELSLQSYINIGIVGTGMFAIVVVLCIEALSDCRRALCRYKVFAYDNTTVTWVYGISAFVSMLVWGCFVLFSALEPSTNSLLPSTEVNGEKISQFGILERVFLTLSVFFGVSAALNVSLSWVDIASTSKKFQKKKDNISYYKKTIRVIQVVWVLLAVLQLALGLSILVLGGGALLVIGCLITYVYGRIEFVRILEQARSGSGSKHSAPGGSKTDADREEKRIMRVLDLIRKTSSAVILALALISAIVISLVVVSLDWKEYGRPGLASAYPTLLNSLVLGLIIAGAAILYYCHKMFENAIHNKIQRSDDTGLTRNASFVPSTQNPKLSTRTEEDML